MCTLTLPLKHWARSGECGTPSLYFNNVIYSAAPCRAARRFSLRPSSIFDFHGRYSGEHSAPFPLRPYLPLTDIARVYVALASNGGTLFYIDLWKSVKELFFISGHARIRTCYAPLGADQTTQISTQLNISCREREFLKDFFGKMPKMS